MISMHIKSQQITSCHWTTVSCSWFCFIISLHDLSVVTQKKKTEKKTCRTVLKQERNATSYVELPTVHYLPSLWWRLFSDFKAAWISTWLKTSLCKQQWTKPLVNKRTTSFRHDILAFDCLELHGMYTVAPLGHGAWSPSASITEIHYSCVCTVFYILTLDVGVSAWAEKLWLLGRAFFTTGPLS